MLTRLLFQVVHIKKNLLKVQCFNKNILKDFIDSKIKEILTNPNHLKLLIIEDIDNENN